VKLKSVAYNNRRKVFLLHTEKGKMEFPYAAAQPQPVPGDYVREAYVDPELGNEAFSYRLESGAEGAIHGDSILEQNEDPEHLSGLMLYHLTLALRDAIEKSPLSKREIIKKSRISAPQLYRLLDPVKTGKSASQIFRVLYALNHDLEFTIHRPRSPAHGKPSRKKAYAISSQSSRVF